MDDRVDLMIRNLVDEGESWACWRQGGTYHLQKYNTPGWDDHGPDVSLGRILTSGNLRSALMAEGVPTDLADELSKRMLPSQEVA